MLLPNILEHFPHVTEPVKNLLDEGSESFEQNKFQDSINFLNQKIYSLMEYIKKTEPEKLD